jgi:hypothetical protein
MSKKRGKSIKININLSNRWLYTLILIGILAAVGVGIYAATYSPSGAGHPYTEISTCGANQILKMNSAGNAWECNTITTIETDPTVQGWAKTNNPTITGSVSVVGTANLSRLIIQKTVLYTIHTYGYAVINSCNELCDINRGQDVAPESHMCLYAWIFEYATNAWQYTTCADTISRQKRCLCLGTLNF